jgi:hypothetical protein
MSAPDLDGLSNWRDFTQVSTRRSFVLMAVGAIGGLLLAGYALFTARGTSTLVVPAEDVALVNQQPISRIDYLVQINTLYGVDLAHSTSEQRQKVLNDMIREELFVQRGKELDVSSSDPDVRNALVNAVEMEISENAITTQPSEAALQKYFDSHKERYASEGIMTVRDLVFPATDPTALANLTAAIKTGVRAPALLSQFHGKDSGKTAEEEFYFAAKIHLGDESYNIAKNLPDGALSAPIKREDGIHVLFMEKNKKPVPIDFVEAQSQVLNDYRNEAIAHLKTGDESFLRKRANILVADDVR